MTVVGVCGGPWLAGGGPPVYASARAQTGSPSRAAAEANARAERTRATAFAATQRVSYLSRWSSLSRAIGSHRTF